MHARELLVQLEQEALTIRSQSKKQETQSALTQKRTLLKSLSERLQELNELGEHDIDDDESEGEDLIGEDTPDEKETDEHTTDEYTPDFVPSPVVSESEFAPPYKEPDPPVSSILRNRGNAADRAELFAPTASTTALATNETLMSHNRTEQEALTTGLSSMAKQLKERSLAFAAALEDEKGVLDNAVAGLDRNQLGLESANTRMGLLQSLSEGKNWWGRILLYAWIAGLWVIALMVVFVLPKLRFG